MNRSIGKRLKVLCLVPLAAIWLTSTTVNAQTAPSMAPGASTPHGSMSMGATGKPDMMKSMMMDMEAMQKMQMSGDTDKDFAMMMKMHHQQALKMAQMQLDHGKSSEMKTMAKQIIVAQKKEIAQFDQWLAKHK